MKKWAYNPYSERVIHTYWRGKFFEYRVDDVTYYRTSIKLSRGLVLYVTMTSPQKIDYGIMIQIEDLHLNSINHYINDGSAYIIKTDYPIRIDEIEQIKLNFAIYTKKRLIWKSNPEPMIIRLCQPASNKLVYIDQALSRMDAAVYGTLSSWRRIKPKRIMS